MTIFINFNYINIFIFCSKRFSITSNHKVTIICLNYWICIVRISTSKSFLPEYVTIFINFDDVSITISITKRFSVTSNHKVTIFCLDYWICFIRITTPESFLPEFVSIFVNFDDVSITISITKRISPTNTYKISIMCFDYCICFVIIFTSESFLPKYMTIFINFNYINIFSSITKRFSVTSNHKVTIFCLDYWICFVRITTPESFLPKFMTIFINFNYISITFSSTKRASITSNYKVTVICLDYWICSVITNTSESFLPKYMTISINFDNINIFLCSIKRGSITSNYKVIVICLDYWICFVIFNTP